MKLFWWTMLYVILAAVVVIFSIFAPAVWSDWIAAAQ